VTHRLWLPEEDRIVDRYARALARGKFRYTWQAAVACCRDLQSLHIVSGQGWIRSPAVAYARLRKRVAILGLPWVGEALTDDEERVLQRYVSGIARGEYERVRDAARLCRDELAGLPIGKRSWHLRSVGSLSCLLTRRLRSAAVTWSSAKWTAEEDAVARRYARALATGKLPDAQVAADRCLAELIRRGARRGSRYLRTRIGIAGKLRSLAREAGWPSFVRPWRPEEKVVRDRYVAALVEGRFRTAKLAAAACTKELADLHRRSRNSPSYAGTLPRSYGAVVRELNDRAYILGLPRYGDKWTLQERRALERHARGVPAGRYGTWLDAARACHAELTNVHERIRRRSPIAVRVLPRRKLIEVHKHIIEVSHKLGLDGPRRVLWTAAEDRVTDGWVRWYEGHRRVRRLKPCGEAVIGLQEELDQIGSSRSLQACREHLFKRRRFLQSVA
jgi:hypothetical protein